MPYFDSSGWFLIEKTTILTNSCCLYVQPTFAVDRGSAAPAGTGWQRSRLHELHESKLLVVSRIEFICSKLSNFSTHVSGSPVRHAGGCHE